MTEVRLRRYTGMFGLVATLSRRDRTAVQIPSRNLFGLRNYKAITLKTPGPGHQSLRKDPGRESGQQGAEQQYSQDQRRSH